MLVSHNTFTYMRPRKLWMWLLIPFTRCQNKPIDKQVMKGVDTVDMRIRYNYRKRRWFVCHGVTTYCNLHEAILLILDYNIKNVRLLIEGKYTQSMIVDLAKELHLYREAFTVFEFRDKSTWKQLINCPTEEYLNQEVGSMKSWYGKILPFLYHIIHRKELKEILANYKETDKLSLDFI